MLAPLLALQLVVGAAAPDAPRPPSALAANEAFTQGLQRYRDADFDAAILYFRRAVSAADDKRQAAQGSLWLGLSFLNTGDRDNAKTSFRAALLADPKIALPDEAPPAATPLFMSVKGELERAPPPVIAKPMPTPPAHPGDVPRGEERPADSDARDLGRELTAEAPASNRPLHLPSWTPGAVVGVGGGLAVAAGGFKLLSNSNFDKAATELNAAEAARLNHSANTQQHVALGLAIGAAVAVASGVALYFMNE